MPTRLQIARKDIFRLFDEHRQTVFRRRDIERILSENRDGWRLTQSTTRGEFIAYLMKSGRLKRHEFPFPQRKEIRYTWGDIPLHTVLLTLKPDCHFSHYTAVQMHELTEQEPKTIYVNHEQPPKPAPAAGLEQGRIDAAFKRKPRTSNNVVELSDFRICLVNGKHTGYLGVETREVAPGNEQGGVSVRVTDIERTLIDITVRPFYAGGVAEVLKAYDRAAPKLSVNRLAALLQQLNYVYPYHQSMGYLLEKSGVYSSNAIGLFRGKFQREFDFYLAYQMGKTRYDERWRLYVPEGF